MHPRSYKFGQDVVMLLLRREQSRVSGTSAVWLGALPLDVVRVERQPPLLEMHL